MEGFIELRGEKGCVVVHDYWRGGTRLRTEAAGALGAGVGVHQQQQEKKEAGACGMGMERELGQVFEGGDSQGESESDI